MVSFQQTVIRVEKEKEFEELRGAIDRALDLEKVEKFLKRVRRSGARIRELEVILAKRVFEKVEFWRKSEGAISRTAFRGQSSYHRSMPS